MEYKKKKLCLPGDIVGVIEEFIPSKNVYQENYNLRSKVIGTASFDFESKIVEVIPKSMNLGIPKVNDEIIGIVDQTQGGIVSVRILEINNKPVHSQFIGLLILRSFAGNVGPKIVLKLGDLIKAKVISLTNNLIHLSINDEKYGVIYTKCSFCGGDVQVVGRRIQCVDCKMVDERKLSSDFGMFKKH
ncbi:MAG: exosome complex RNA-binding protein Csl4 [Nitrososphaeria archaeon]|nr:exosome complex RNA-binding protein Csl4 [Nitrososphaeria archaeon]